MSEREEAGIRERDNCCRRSSLCFLGFTFAIGAHYIFEVFMGFSPLWFPRGNYLCLLSLVIIFVHVILSNKILDHIDEMIKI